MILHSLFPYTQYMYSLKYTPAKHILLHCNKNLNILDEATSQYILLLFNQNTQTFGNKLTLQTTIKVKYTVSKNLYTYNTKIILLKLNIQHCRR